MYPKLQRTVFCSSPVQAWSCTERTVDCDVIHIYRLVYCKSIVRPVMTLGLSGPWREGCISAESPQNFLVKITLCTAVVSNFSQTWKTGSASRAAGYR